MNQLFNDEYVRRINKENKLIQDIIKGIKENDLYFIRDVLNFEYSTRIIQKLAEHFGYQELQEYFLPGNFELPENITVGYSHCLRPVFPVESNFEKRYNLISIENGIGLYQINNDQFISDNMPKEVYVRYNDKLYLEIIK